jgi:hypothetical protein
MDHILDSISEEGLATKVKQRVDDLFGSKSEKSQLQVHKLYWHLGDDNALRTAIDDDVGSTFELEALEEVQNSIEG